MGASFLSRATMPGTIQPTGISSNSGVFTTPASYTSVLLAIKISTLGNTFLFGLGGNSAGGQAAGFSSNTRGIQAGGALSGPPYTAYNFISYITFATYGDLQNFGTLSNTKAGAAGASNQTRGIIAGGAPARSDIDYVTIATIGNATNFGSLGAGWEYLVSGCQSPTRGCWAGGFRSSSSSNRIDYVDFATTGNSNYFGNLTVARYLTPANSSSTRGIWNGGGYAATTMDYITIASTGNATSFGTSIYQHDAAGAAVSDNTKIVWLGSSDWSFNAGRTMEYVTIATTGNSIAFGDGATTALGGSMSNNHGGLQ